MTTRREPPRLPDVDARAIVPVTDEIGGVVIYAAGRPAYYVLNGEWFEALPEPRAAVRRPAAAASAEAGPDAPPAGAVGSLPPVEGGRAGSTGR